MRRELRITLIGVVLGGLCAGVAGAQPSTSADPASTLVQLLEARKTDAVGAKDPDEPGRFVAALHYPGTLLVVSAVYPAPTLLDQRLERREYREVYLDLQGAGAVQTRFFVQDLQGNGLRATSEPGQPFDIVFERGTRQTTFDGEWKDQGLSEQEYKARFDEADARYARMLALLVAALRGAS